MGGFAPDHVRIRRVSQAARNCRVNAAAKLVEAFGSALSVDEFAVARVGVGKQEARRIRVRACNQNRWHTTNVRGKACSDELLNEFANRHDYFSAQMAALLRGGKLIFKVHARST